MIVKFSEKIKFTYCDEEKIYEATQFCNENGFTPRTKEKWLNESIKAIIALENNKIIACFPYQIKNIKTSKGFKNLGHFTAVSVAKSFRGKGLGSELISYLHKNTNLEGFIVNSIKNNLASNWYIKNGYYFVNCCEVYYKEINIKNFDNQLGMNYQIRKINCELEEEVLLNSFNNFNKDYRCFEKREIGYWKQKIRTHYYSDYNDYFLIFNQANDLILGYCLFSISKRNEKNKSIHTLEIAYSDNSSLSYLVKSLTNYAYKLKISKLRIQISNDEFFKNFLLENFFLHDYSYDILAFLKNEKVRILTPSRFHHIEYI